MAYNPERALLIHSDAAKTLIADIRAQHGADIFDGDEETLLDTIEGETNLADAIAAALNARDEDLMLVAGIEERMEALATRKKRLVDAADRKKAAIERAMVTAELKTLPLPTATITLKSVPPGLVVTEEADIPSDFYSQPEPPAPKLDKKALIAKLRENKAAFDEAMALARAIDDDGERAAAIDAANAGMVRIAGAELDNGGVALQIRVK